MPETAGVIYHVYANQIPTEWLDVIDQLDDNARPETSWADGGPPRLIIDLGEQPWGLDSEDSLLLVELLQAAGIAYDSWDSGSESGDWGPYMQWWRPGGDVEWRPTDIVGRPVISIDQIDRKGLSTRQRIREWLTPSPVPPPRR